MDAQRDERNGIFRPGHWHGRLWWIHVGHQGRPLHYRWVWLHSKPKFPCRLFYQWSFLVFQSCGCCSQTASTIAVLLQGCFFFANLSTSHYEAWSIRRSCCSTSEVCAIAVNTTAAVPIVVQNFSTEKDYDAVIVNCKIYSGTDGPAGVIPDSTIYWFSDGSVNAAGWRICPSWVLSCFRLLMSATWDLRFGCVEFVHVSCDAWLL